MSSSLVYTSLFCFSITSIIAYFFTILFPSLCRFYLDSCVCLFIVLFPILSSTSLASLSVLSIGNSVCTAALVNILVLTTANTTFLLHTTAPSPPDLSMYSYLLRWGRVLLIALLVWDFSDSVNFSSCMYSCYFCILLIYYYFTIKSLWLYIFFVLFLFFYFLYIIDRRSYVISSMCLFVN